MERTRAGRADRLDERRMAKHRVFETDRTLTDLYCLEPGRSSSSTSTRTPTRSWWSWPAGSWSGSRTTPPRPASTRPSSPPAYPHAIKNLGPDPAVLLVFVGPALPQARALGTRSSQRLKGTIAFQSASRWSSSSPVWSQGARSAMVEDQERALSRSALGWSAVQGLGMRWRGRGTAPGLAGRLASTARRPGRARHGGRTCPARAAGVVEAGGGVQAGRADVDVEAGADLGLSPPRRGARGWRRSTTSCTGSCPCWKRRSR